MRGKLFDPQKVRMTPEEVEFKSDLGEIIHAWYFSSTAKGPSKGTILFFHGNAENISSHFLMLHWLPAQGYNYLIFDYPGYGDSSGTPTPRNTVAAGRAAVKWIKQEKDTRPLIIYGHSLGGIIALRTVQELKDTQSFQALIIDGSFASYRGMGRYVLRRQWWTWPLQPLTYVLLSDSYAPDNLSGLSPLPILFMHGDADRAVEFQNSEEMFAQAKEPKEFWLVPGGQHGNLFEVNKGELRARFLSFLERTLTVPK